MRMRRELLRCNFNKNCDSMKYLLQWTVVFLGFVFITVDVLAYTSPGKPTGYVNDYTDTLSTSAMVDIEDILGRFDNEGRGEVAVVLIPTLHGDTIENYSIALAREWGIGQKGNDNGVLLIVAKDDHELRIEVGYGFEGVLTDAKSSRIIRDVIVPRFKEENYDLGIADGVREILGAIDPAFEGAKSTIDYTDKSTPTNISVQDFPAGVFAFIFFFILVWSGSVLGRSKSWWLGGVVGFIVGVIIAVKFGFLYIGLAAIIALSFIGLLFDYIVSKLYSQSVSTGSRLPWWAGGGSGRGSSFGGFGGGSFGGGGSSGRW